MYNYNIVLAHAISLLVADLIHNTPWLLGGGVINSNTPVPDHVVQTMVRQSQQVSSIPDLSSC